MKSIKVLVAALALCVMASVPALHAQGKSDGKGKGNDQQIDKIDKKVGGLSSGQKTTINNILATAQEQMLALTRGERRTTGEDIRKASMAAVRKTLTPAQQKKFDDLKTP